MKEQIKESIQSILIDSRFLKLHKDNRGKWRVENINQKHLKNFQAFSLNVAQEAADLSKAKFVYLKSTIDVIYQYSKEPGVFRVLLV